MIGISRSRGYRLHPPDSPEAEALLAVDIELNAMGIESWLDRDGRQ